MRDGWPTSTTRAQLSGRSLLVPLGGVRLLRCARGGCAPQRRRLSVKRPWRGLRVPVAG